MSTGGPVIAARHSITQRLTAQALHTRPPLTSSSRLRQSVRPYQAATPNAAHVARQLPRAQWHIAPLARLRNTRVYSQNRPTAPPEQEPRAPKSLSEKFKGLSRKYGWAAVGVYLALSVLDFPFCFMAVRLIGPGRIGEVEHAVTERFWGLVGMIIPSMSPTAGDAAEEVDDVHLIAMRRKEQASIWTQLLLAYGVHKSLIFFRIPLTAAVTPKLVKTLRSWGWNIGPRVKKRA